MFSFFVLNLLILLGNVFQQAIWKPLVNAFATMCGLVVPIALAHAGCLSRLARLHSSQLPRVRTPLGDSAPGAFAPVTAVVATVGDRAAGEAATRADACNSGPLGRADSRNGRAKTHDLRTPCAPSATRFSKMHRRTQHCIH